MLVICLNVIAGGGGSNLYPPGQFDTFSQEEIKDRIKGSKIVIISEQVGLPLFLAARTQTSILTMCPSLC